MVDEFTLFGLAAAGAVLLYELFTGEEKKAKHRWETAHAEQRHVLKTENERIQRQLAHAQQRLQREQLRQSYHTSITLGNDAYALMQDAKTVLGGLNRQIHKINHHRAQLQTQLEFLREQRDHAGMRQCIEELKAINLTRHTAFVERDRIKVEKEDLLAQVHTVNERTRELRQQLEGLGWVRPSARLKT